MVHKYEAYCVLKGEEDNLLGISILVSLQTARSSCRTRSYKQVRPICASASLRMALVSVTTCNRSMEDPRFFIEITTFFSPTKSRSRLVTLCYRKQLEPNIRARVIVGASLLIVHTAPHWNFPLPVT